MEISHKETVREIMVISVSGRIKLGDESEKIETLVADVIAKGRRNIVFELSGVKYIDSTGIGRFISSLNKVMEAGGKLRMAGASGVVREAFRVTRLDTVFKFFPDVEAACEGLN